MVEEKPDLNYDDWDSLPVAPDDDWDNIPPPRNIPSDEQTETEATPQIPAGAPSGEPGAGSSSLQSGRSGNKPSRPPVDRASLTAILSDDDNLNEDFDNLVDVSGDDLDDIDIGEPGDIPEDELGLAAPKLTSDFFDEEPARPLSPVLGEEPEPARPLGLDGLEGAVSASVSLDELDHEAVPPDFEAPKTTVELNVGDFEESLSLAGQGEVDPDEPRPPFDAHLLEDETSPDESDPSPSGPVKAAAAPEPGPGEPAGEAEPDGADASDPAELDGLKTLQDISAPPNGVTAVSALPDSLASDLQDIATQKVELDIEGIFLDEHGPEAEKEPQEAVEEENHLAEEAGAEPDQDVPEPPGLPDSDAAKGLKARIKSLPATLKKIPKAKLLLVLAPVFLLMAGMSFGVYKLFFSSVQETAVRAIVIDPTVPPRPAEPGILDLGPFYVSFPAESGVGETIVEMTFAVHYNDLPDRAALESRMTTVRDLIFRSARGKGGQVAASGDVQRELRDDLRGQLNALAGGGDRIDYVQIVQVRILR